MKLVFFVSNFLFLYMLFYVIVCYNKGKEGTPMNLHISKEPLINTLTNIPNYHHQPIWG